MASLHVKKIIPPVKDNVTFKLITPFYGDSMGFFRGNTFQVAVNKDFSYAISKYPYSLQAFLGLASSLPISHIG